MSKTYFTVGPAAIYPTISGHVQQFLQDQLGSISHRSETFRSIYSHTDAQLKQLLNIPSDYCIFFVGSASEVWERIILNTVEHRSHHLINGDFSNRFYSYSKSLGKASDAFQIEPGVDFDIRDFQIPKDAELIGICQNETSTGVAIPMDMIYAIGKENPNALMALDIVSAVPQINIDISQVDMAYFSGQKGMGLPTGIGVWIVSPRAIEKAKQLKSKGVFQGAHHTINALYKNYCNFETPSTPNILGIYLMGKIAEDMNAIGIENIRTVTIKKSKMLYNAIEQSTILQNAVRNPLSQSPTVIVANTSNPRAFMEKLSQNNMVVSSGYGANKDTQIRIGNFPAHSIEDIEQLIALF